METLYNQCFGKTSGGVEIVQDLVLFCSYQRIRIYCALNQSQFSPTTTAGMLKASPGYLVIFIKTVVQSGIPFVQTHARTRSEDSREKE